MNKKVCSIIVCMTMAISIFGLIGVAKETNTTSSITGSIRHSGSGTLIYGTSSAPVDWDCLYAWDTASYDVLTQICEGLYEYNYSDPNAPLIPMLATSSHWDGTKNLTVNLRQGVTFQDGTPFNATAAKWNFDRMLWSFDDTSELATPFNTGTPASIAQIVSLYQCPNGTQLFQPVIVLNNTAIKFVLNEPYTAFTSLLAFQGSFMESPASTPAKSEINVTGSSYRPVGTGPFEFGSYVVGDHVLLNENPNYWRGASKLAGVYYDIILDAQTRNNAMVSQTINILPDPLLTMIMAGSFNITGEAVHQGISNLIIDYIGMNNQLINQTVRKALSFAYNYTYHITQIMQNGVTRLHGPIPAGMAFYNGSIPYVMGQNTTIARQALIKMAQDDGLSWAAAAQTNLHTDSWWTTKAATSPIAIYNYTYNAGNQIRQEIGALLVSCSALIGIKITSVIAADWKAETMALSTWSQQKYYPLFTMGWAPDFNDPEDYVDPLLVPSPATSDFAHVNDAHINASIAAGFSATTTVGRQAAYNDLMNYTQNYLYPWIFLHQDHPSQVWTDNVLGYTMNIMGQCYFYNVQFATVPDIPTSFVVSSIGGTWLYLTWAAPASNGGSTITGYNVYRGTTPDGETLLTTVTTLHYNDTGLTNGQIYYYKVCAVNSIGLGPNATEVSDTPSIVPGAPTSFVVSSIGGTWLYLTWAAPASNGGSTIAGYCVFRGTTPDGETFLTAVTTLYYNDTGLTNGQIYYYKVCAVNAIGLGPNATEVSRTPSIVPGAPTSFIVSSIGGTWLYLTWAAPSSNGGSTITGYNVYRGTTPGGETLLKTVTTLYYNNTGLTNGQIYYYKVCAVNARGPGPNATEVNGRPVMMPTSPQALNTTPGDTQITLTWTAPVSNGGSPIIGYKIYRGISIGSEELYTTIGSMTTFTDTGLINGQAYYYKVSAVTSVGESALSAEATATPKSTSTGGASTPGYPMAYTIGILAITSIVIVVKKRRTFKS